MKPALQTEKTGLLAKSGREINTIGSKSSEAGMQKVVVQMKMSWKKLKNNC